MREPVSLGYLLARIADTLADTAAAPLELRKQALADFRDAALSGDPCPDFATDFADHQTHDGERLLLSRSDECVSLLKNLSEANQTSVKAVLDTITKGQLWDLEKFATPEAVVTESELIDYTYSVAGCVGEFWTTIGYDNLGEKFADPADREALLKHGRQFGQALQLLNILRDAGEDLKNGRSYLPPSTNQQGTFDEPTLLVRNAAPWREQCQTWLGSGWEYVSKIRHPRVRFATVLPLIIGEKTLAKIEAAGPDAFTEKIKIDRGEVKRILIKAWWHRKRVEKLREI